MGGLAPEARKTDLRLVLDVVANIYATEGARGASIRHIATAVGLAPSALYYYFGSKEGMIQMALSKCARDALRSMQSHGAGENDDSKFQRRVEANLEVLVFDCAYGALHARQVVSFANGETSYFPVADYRAGIQEFIGLRPSGAPPIDARTAFIICAALHGVAELSRVEKQLAGGGLFTEDEKTEIRQRALIAALAIARAELVGLARPEDEIGARAHDYLA